MKKHVKLNAEMQAILEHMVELKKNEIFNALFYVINAEYIPDKVKADDVFNSDFYTNLHQNNIAYQNNNWFLDKYIDILQRKNIKSCFELGSGNGKTTEKLSKFMELVISVDFNPNPFSHIENVKSYVGSFFEVPHDVKAEITISADAVWALVYRLAVPNHLEGAVPEPDRPSQIMTVHDEGESKWRVYG